MHGKRLSGFIADYSPVGILRAKRFSSLLMNSSGVDIPEGTRHLGFLWISAIRSAAFIWYTS
jgi:hypothetical protein